MAAASAPVVRWERTWVSPTIVTHPDQAAHMPGQQPVNKNEPGGVKLAHNNRMKIYKWTKSESKKPEYFADDDLLPSVTELLRPPTPPAPKPEQTTTQPPAQQTQQPQQQQQQQPTQEKARGQSPPKSPIREQGVVAQKAQEVEEEHETSAVRIEEVPEDEEPVKNGDGDDVEDGMMDNDDDNEDQGTPAADESGDNGDDDQMDVDDNDQE